jgi:hypothetical protein
MAAMQGALLCMRRRLVADPLQGREHRPHGSTGVLKSFDCPWNTLRRRGRSSVHLLGEVILEAQLVDQVELGFEKVDVFFLVFQENLEEIG